MPTQTLRQHAAPPAILRLAAHPIRWRLLAELGRSDRKVSELVDCVGRPANLVSYHLGQLRAEGVVSARRSSADGRGAYYTLNLARCGELLGAAGAELHPALAPARPAGTADDSAQRPVRILFVCTGNSSRSQLAEGFARNLGDASVEVVSGGSHPKEVHPNAIRVARAHGIDLRGASAKHFSVFADRAFDYVVTLCDRAREVCPPFPGAPELIHWSIPDPADPADGPENYATFERVAADIRDRVTSLLGVIRQRKVKGARHA